jgi:hypothetical protein
VVAHFGSLGLLPVTLRSQIVTLAILLSGFSVSVGAESPSSKDLDLTHGQISSVCAVHHVPMRIVRVKILYGLMQYRDGYLKAEHRYFPNSGDDISGGCIRDEKSPDHALMFKCRKCARALDRWASAHPN